MIAVPIEWRTVRVGDVFNIKQGKSLSREKQTGNKRRRFLRTANVFWGRLKLDRLDEMDFTDVECASLALKAGDLLVCEGGDIGRTAMWAGEIDDCYYQNHLHRLRRTSNDVLPFFVMCWMQAAFTQLNVYEGAGNKTTIPNLSRSRLAELPIPLPPLPEQKKIAAILLKLQHAISAQDKLIQSLRDLKKSTMQHLFTHGLRGEKTKMTEIGEIPESWEVTRLGDIAAIERGKFTHRPRNDPAYYGGGIPFVQTGDVARSNGRIRTYSQTLNERGLSVSKVFREGTVLLTIAANIGDTGILEFDSAFPDSIVGITPSSQIASEFLEFYLRTQKQRMHQLAPKGTQMNISIQFLKPWPVALAPMPEQKEILTSLSGIESRIRVYESKTSALQNLFNTTLNKLMTGDIRVADLEIDVKEVEG